MFGHWFEIMGIALLALLVFGPKRMIEMGSSFGKALRELRESTKDLNISNLVTGLTNDEPSSEPTALSRLSQFSQTLATRGATEDSKEQVVAAPTTATVETPTE